MVEAFPSDIFIKENLTGSLLVVSKEFALKDCNKVARTITSVGKQMQDLYTRRSKKTHAHQLQQQLRYELSHFQLGLDER